MQRNRENYSCSGATHGECFCELYYFVNSLILQQLLSQYEFSTPSGIKLNDRQGIGVV